MKKPINYLPAIMMASIVLIILTLFTLQYSQTIEYYDYSDLDIDQSKVNQPGPLSQNDETEEGLYPLSKNEGKIVFLKEEIQKNESETPPSQLASDNALDAETEEQIFMDLITIDEPLTSEDGVDKYLVIAGTYTDNMVLLSKQAQYMNKGYDAQIIQFKNNTAKNICMGRYTDSSSAESLAEEIETTHDISAYVYHQDAGSR